MKVNYEWWIGYIKGYIQLGMSPDSTSTTNAWPKQAICGRNKCIKIRIRRHLMTTRHKWWLAPLQLHIKVIQRNRTKLRDLWLRTTGNHLSTHWVVTLPARIPTPNHNSLRPQKPHILQDSSETEQTTSKMASHSLRIQHQAYPRAWKADGPIQCAITMTRSMSWQRHR